MTGNETGGVGGEKNRGACQLFDLPKPSHRRAHQEFPPTLGSIEQSGIQVRAQYAWNESIDADSGCSPFDGKGFREGRNSRLTGIVCGNFKEPDKGCQRAYIDDATVALLDHVPAKYSAGAQSPVQIRFDDRIPIGFRNFERGHSPRAAGAVHQNLDGAEFGAYRLQELFEAGVVGDVAGLRKRPTSERNNLRGGSANLFFAAARRHDIGTSLGQSTSEGQADAAG